MTLDSKSLSYTIPAMSQKSWISNHPTSNMAEVTLPPNPNNPWKFDTILRLQVIMRVFPSSSFSFVTHNNQICNVAYFVKFTSKWSWIWWLSCAANDNGAGGNRSARERNARAAQTPLTGLGVNSIEFQQTFQRAFQQSFASTPSMVYNGHAITGTYSQSYRLYKRGCMNHIREL